MFSPRVHDSSVKIKRWCLKIISDYPQLVFYYVKTTDNLADFLTREGMPAGDIEKFNLKDIEIKDFYDELPKHDFTVSEWINFVEHNQHL